MNAQAIELAKDVLEHISRYVPKQSAWLSIYGKVKPEDLDLEFRDYVKDRSCSACALGSLFLAYANLYNHIPVRTLVDTEYMEVEGYAYITLDIHGIEKKLTTVFSHDQLILIEIAFELGVGLFQVRSDDEGRVQAYNFGQQHKTPKDRLVAIMENIIANDGEFKP